MQRTRFTSRNPAAERRAEFAETLKALGDHTGAIEAMTAALELDADWPAGWYRLGDLQAEAANPTAAANAFQKALSLDPDDSLGARARMELVTGERVAETLPPAFVEALFDQYAPRFDAALTEKLGYRGPEILMRALSHTGFAHAARALDLGCGTGLMGEALRARCTVLEGVDLSAGMLERARRRGLYDRLEKADIAAIPLAEPAYDLIVAADVFAYLGALDGVLAWAAGSLAPGGRLAFTVETGAGPGYTLQPSRRYAHGRAYLETLLAQAGLRAVSIAPCVVRRDRGADIDSFVVTAARPPAPRALEGGEEAALA